MLYNSRDFNSFAEFGQHRQRDMPGQALPKAKKIAGI